MSGLDWAVLGCYALIVVGIGVYYQRQNKTAEDFVLGGRSMSPIALGLSLFATLCSTLSYLAWPGEVLAHGPMLLAQFAASPLILLIVGYGLIPLLMRQPVTSAYEILEDRLGRSIRLAGAGVFLLLRLGWMATILYATVSVVMIPLLQLDRGWIPWLCLGMGIVTVLYSASGGIRAVVVTDALQSIMMLVGAILTVCVISWKMGGVSNWWPEVWPSHWDSPRWGFDPQARLSFGAVVMSTLVWYVCTNGSDQMSVQRFLSTRNPAAARQTLFVSLLSEFVVTILLATAGLALLGFCTNNPAVLEPGEDLVSVADQVFPRFIMRVLPDGLSGLVISAILAAAMSSLSSGVNSTCAVLDRDFLSLLPGEQPTGQAAVNRMRALSWGVGVVSVGLSILNGLIQGNLIERCYKVVNLLTAPLFVLFFLALFVRWSNALGAWLGLIASIAMAVAIAYGEILGMMWMMPVALTTGIIVGTVGSMLAAPWGAERR